VLRAAECVPPSLLRSFGAAVAAVVIAASPAAAQTPSRPGPWALDVRGVTSPVPDDASFYPTLSAAQIPARGYGIDVGAHVYLFNAGPSRIGVGGNVLEIRSTTTSTITQTVDDGSTSVSAGQSLTLRMRIIAPQLSFNFGSRDGWSYVSLGAGVASVRTRAGNLLPGSSESERLRALNVGGGARWFFKSRLAFGFDLRVHRISAGSAVGSTDSVSSTQSTPSMTAMSISAGFSFR
jgi:hypothetical protein